MANVNVTGNYVIDGQYIVNEQNLNSSLNAILEASQTGGEERNTLQAQNTFSNYLNTKQKIQLNKSPLTSIPTADDYISVNVQQSSGACGVYKNYNPPIPSDVNDVILSARNGGTQPNKILFKDYFNGNTDESLFSTFSCGKELLSFIVANMIHTNPDLNKLPLTWLDGASPVTLTMDTTVEEIVKGTDMLPYGTDPSTLSPVPVDPVWLPQGLDTVTVRHLVQQTAGFSNLQSGLSYSFTQEALIGPVDGATLAPFYFRNMYLMWSLFLTAVGITGDLVAPDLNVTPLLAPPLFALDSANVVAYGTAYTVAATIWNGVFANPLVPDHNKYAYAFEAVLYFYAGTQHTGLTYADFATAFFPLDANPTTGAAYYAAGAAALNLAKGYLLTETLDAPSGRGKLPVSHLVSIKTFASFVITVTDPDFQYGSPQYGKGANVLLKSLVNLINNIGYYKQGLVDNPAQFLFDPLIQVEESHEYVNTVGNRYQSGFCNYIDSPGNYDDPANIIDAISGFEYSNMGYNFLGRVMQIALAKSVNSFAGAYAALYYTPIQTAWLTDYNYLSTLWTVSGAGYPATTGDHYSGYPANDTFYSALGAGNGLSPLTVSPYGATSIVASIRDNFRRYVATNICVPAGMPIGPAFFAGYLSPILSPPYFDATASDQSFGYYQYGMALQLQAARTGQILFDLTRMRLNDAMKMGSAVLGDSTTIRLAIVAGWTGTGALPTDPLTGAPYFTKLMDPEFLYNVLTGAVNADNTTNITNNCHTWISNTTVNYNKTSKFIYNAYGQILTSTSYFTNCINPGIGHNPNPFYLNNAGAFNENYKINNSLSIPNIGLDQGATETFYWSSGFWVEQPNNYPSGNIYNKPSVLSFRGLNGQNILMDLSAQLVNIRFTSTMAELPGAIPDFQAYYGGTNGNNGVLNNTMSVVTLTDPELAVIGIVPVNPYPPPPINYAERVLGYTYYLTGKLLPDNLTTLIGYNTISNFVGGATNYSALVDYYTYLKNTLGKLPDPTQPAPYVRSSPYFKSIPVQTISCIGDLFSIEYDSAVVPNNANPFQLRLKDYVLNEIHVNHAVPLFKNLG